MQTLTYEDKKKALGYIPLPQPQLMNKLRAARRLCKLSQREVGESIGCSYQSISYWESGSRLPSVEYLVLLARLYGKSDDYFCTAVSASRQDRGSLACNLRTFRKDLCISQQRLSELTGIPLVQIKDFENPDSFRHISDAQLGVIASVFSVEPESILGSDFTQESYSRYVKKSLRNRLEIALAKLSDLGLEEAVKRIEELAELKQYKL